MLEAGGEDFSDHETLGQFVGEEVVGLVVEETAQLFRFEGIVVQHSDPQLVLLLVIHNNNYYCKSYRPIVHSSMTHRDIRQFQVLYKAIGMAG